MTFVIWGIVGLLALFSASAVVLVGREILRSRAARTDAPRRLSSAFSDYIGPVDRRLAPLNPPLRVAVELFCSLFGFPGIGWMVSGRITVGLPLVVLVPAALWMFYPLYISSAWVVLEHPLSVLAVLPPIALLSAGFLAAAEFSEARAR